MKHWEDCPPRAITDPFPFRDHRSMLEVMISELPAGRRRKLVAWLEEEAKHFTADSFK